MPRLIPRRLAPDEQATLVEHLSELRHRIVIIVVAIVPAFLFTYAIHGWLIGKLKDLLPEGTKVVTLGVTEPFTTSVKVSFYAALGICLPIVIWQIWAFFAPALDRKVQRTLSMFVVFASALFLTGVAFGYFVLLPRALSFLIGYDGDLYEEQVRASYFLSFVTLMLFATGIAFLMPIFILGLVRVGALSSGTLRRNRRIGIVAMTCFAILLPTVDPVSLIFETLPLIALYELSIWLAVLMERRWEPLEDDEDFDVSDHAPFEADADESGTAADDVEEEPDDYEFDDLDGFDDETYTFDESVFDDEPEDATEPRRATTRPASRPGTRKSRRREGRLGRLGDPDRCRADRGRRGRNRRHGRIEAVGPISELGEGEHFAGSVIIPGLVNAHAHLEYAVYAGFGDGLPFVPWIGLHVRRKAALSLDDMRAIATVGAWESLRSGVTTVGDCSFIGRDRRGRGRGGPARARLPRGLRTRRRRARPLPRAARADRAGSLRPRPRRDQPTRPVHVHPGGVRGRGGARLADADPLRGERGRARLARRRRGRLDSAGRASRAAAG